MRTGVHNGSGVPAGGARPDRASDADRVRAVVAAFVVIIEEGPALHRCAYAQARRAGRTDLVARTGVAEALAWGGLWRLLPPAPGG